MHFDTHCHLDLFDDPIKIAKSYETSSTHCVMATILPSHYQMALPHIKTFNYIKPALGFHPLHVKECQNEFNLFRKYVKSVEYVGEIGLDCSKDGKDSFKLQLSVFKQILSTLGSGQFVTIHSRYAHKEVAKMLCDADVGPVCFHYFIGGIKAAKELAQGGHYFSINHKMLEGKHKNLLNVVPREQILIESDGPFLTKKPLSMIKHIYYELGKIWKEDKKIVEEQLEANFYNCRTNN